MAIELRIDGYFEMNIFNKLGREVDVETELSILDNLQQGEYLITLSSGKIYDINDFKDYLYTFKIVPTDATEYDFDEL